MELGDFSDLGGGEASAQWPRPGASLLLFPGLSPQLCLQGSSDCRKQCDQDYFLDRDGRCKACVSCSGGKSLVFPPGVPSREQGVGVLQERLRVWGWRAHVWSRTAQPLGTWFSSGVLSSQLLVTPTHHCGFLMAVTPFQRASIRSLFPARKHLLITSLF